MRLKGYLRGLGAGIFISAVLMGIATSGKGTMTDAEVKERAAALGMVEEDALLVKPKLEETIPELPADDGKNDDKDREDDASAPDVEIKPVPVFSLPMIPSLSGDCIPVVKLSSP